MILRKQYPLRLAYAMTVHKSQGKTIEKACLDFTTHMFSHGMLYVALSRVRGFKSFVVYEDSVSQNNGELSEFIEARNIVFPAMKLKEERFILDKSMKDVRLDDLSLTNSTDSNKNNKQINVKKDENIKMRSKVTFKHFQDWKKERIQNINSEIATNTSKKSIPKFKKVQEINDLEAPIDIDNLQSIVNVFAPEVIDLSQEPTDPWERPTFTFPDTFGIDEMMSIDNISLYDKEWIINTFDSLELNKFIDCRDDLSLGGCHWEWLVNFYPLKEVHSDELYNLKDSTSINNLNLSDVLRDLGSIVTESKCKNNDGWVASNLTPKKIRGLNLSSMCDVSFDTIFKQQYPSWATMDCLNYFINRSCPNCKNWIPFKGNLGAQQLTETTDPVELKIIRKSIEHEEIGKNYDNYVFGIKILITLLFTQQDVQIITIHGI